jgi:hypothetical protein
MGIHLQVVANDRLYTVTPDLVLDFRLLFSGRATDAVAGEPIATGLEIEGERFGLLLKVAADGFFAGGGLPEEVFPNLAAQPHDVDVVLSAPGFRPLAQTLHFAAGTALPVDLGDFELSRLPVRLQGRITEVAGDHDPIGAAEVRLTTPRALALRAPLAFDHAVGTPVRRCDLTAAGPAKALTREARLGETRIGLTNRAGLALGGVLRLGPAHRYTFAIIDDLPPQPADHNQPGEAGLSAPLPRSFPDGAPVRSIAVNPHPEVAAISPREAVAGEGLLVVDVPLAAAAVAIEPLASPLLEYAVVDAVADAEGFYRIDGINHLADLAFVASAAGFLDRPGVVRLDYDQAVNTLDFRLE